MRKQYPKFYFSSLIFASGVSVDLHGSIYTKSPRQQSVKRQKTEVYSQIRFPNSSFSRL